MADIINMPNPEPRGGSGFGLFGLGLLGAGAYLLYKKVTGHTTQSQNTGSSGGGFFEEIFGGGGGSSSSSSGTPTGTTTPEPVPIQPSLVPEATKNASSSSGSSKVTTTTYGVSDYKPMSSAVSSFLAAGRTDEEKEDLAFMLKAADSLSPDYYVLEGTRNGTPVYNVISGTTGQIVGGGAGISYADAVAGGYERRDNLLVISSPGDKSSQGTQASGAAQALVISINSGSSSSGGTSAPNKDVCSAISSTGCGTGSGTTTFGASCCMACVRSGI